MKRRAIGVVLGVVVLCVVYAVQGQVVPGNLPVLTDRHAFVATHISSVTHVVLVGTGAGSIPISTIGHVSSVVHIAASGTGTPGQSISVRCANTAGTAFEACGGGSTTIDTIQHISGSVHIAGTIRGAAFHVQGVGTPGQSHGGVLTVQGVTGMNPVTVSQSTANWTTAHISSAVHVVGTLSGSVNVAHVSGAIHVAGTLRMRQHISGGFTMGQVSECGTAARTVIATNASRRSLILQNAGGRLMYVGGTHATLTTSNGFPLHASGTSDNPEIWHAALSRLELPFYRGPIACLTVGAGSTLVFIEILDPGGGISTSGF